MENISISRVRITSGRMSSLFFRISGVFAISLMAANCASDSKLASKVDPKYGVTASPRVVENGQNVPKGGGAYRVGKPYVVAGKTYVPEHRPDYRAEGIASWYGADFHGRRTANGEVYDMQSLTAAHPTLPMPSYVRVTNLSNKRSVVVRVNDRGPFHNNRLIDLSIKTAEVLGFKAMGVANVRVEYVGPAELQGSDDRKLLATYRENGEPAPAPSSIMTAALKPAIPSAPSQPVLDTLKTASVSDISAPIAMPRPKPAPVSIEQVISANESQVQKSPTSALAFSDTPESATSSSGFLGYSELSAAPAEGQRLAVMDGRGLY